MRTKKKVTKSPFVGYCKHCFMMLAEIDLMKPGYKCPHCAKYTIGGELVTKHPECAVN